MQHFSGRACSRESGVESGFVGVIAAGDVDVPSAIKSHAAAIGADFMVMGGYGHSRLREFILGGVTRTVLTSSTIPVLMSH